MSKMVIYFSRASENYVDGEITVLNKGNTELLAEKIAEMVGAEIFRVQPKVNYSEEYFSCIEEARAHKWDNVRPELEAIPYIDDCDVIYIGYPVYWDTMPMPMFTLVESLNLEGKTVYPFCTHEGSGIADSIRDLTKAAKGAKIKKSFSLKGSNIDDEEMMTIMLERWINS